MIHTGTHINYYHVCKRKLWLFHHGIQMEQTSDLVYAGKLIDEQSYGQRSDKYSQIELDGIKIDFYDARNKVVHETKKSDKIEGAHEAQLKYYLWKLEKHGVTGASGILEYPKIRHKTVVELTDADRQAINQWEAEIESIVMNSVCPPVINKPMCKKCAYYELCYVKE